MLLMGLDVGTTGCKAVVFDRRGRVQVSAYREYPLLHPETDWSELDPNTVWVSLVETIRQCMKGVKDPREIASISVSAQGEAFTPMSREGEHLYRCITTWDYRAREQHDSFTEKFGRKALFRLTGHPSSPIYTLYKIVWLREKHREIYEKTWKFLLWEDFVNWRLCGEPVIDHSLASRTMLFDVGKREWCEEILQESKIEQEKLPQTLHSGKIVGEVNAEASKQTGLARGTLVATGGHDQACGALGVGAIDQGVSYLSTGTVECVTAPLDSPILSQNALSQGYANYCHTAPDRYLILGANPTAGSVLRWMRDNFYQWEKEDVAKAGRDIYDVMIEEASRSLPGSKGLVFLPHFMGGGNPTFDSESKGAILGLTLAHSRGDIVRAALEGISHQLRWNVEALSGLGAEIGELRAVGGGARSTFWLQLKADIARRRIVTPRIEEAASLGAAKLSGLACKVYSDLNEAISSTTIESRTFLPCEQDDYADSHNAFRRVYEALRKMRGEI